MTAKILKNLVEYLCRKMLKGVVIWEVEFLTTIKLFSCFGLGEAGVW